MAEPTPPPSLVHEELARLLDNSAMRRAPSHIRLLRYLVEKCVAGDAQALRETSIALAVFRRDPSTYDPQTDPIVRVTAGRLRQRLEAHYAHYDAPPKLRIVLPKGRYAPEFVAHDGAVPAAQGVAVLRTRNYTGEERFELCCREFADRLADGLARAGFPRVIARGSIDSAEAVSRDLPALGTRLEVPWLLDSTLSREQRHDLRLSVRLVHAADASVRWVETAVDVADEVYRLIDRVRDHATLRTFETLPAGTGTRVRTPPRSALPELQRAALEQARLWLLQRTIAGTDEALALAEGVTRTHADSAEAWATLAAAQYSRMSFMDRDWVVVLARLRETVERALALDPEQPMALRTKAIVLGKVDYDAAGAERMFLRALGVMPQYTSARINYAELLMLAGRGDEAIAQLNLARLHDTLSATVHLARATCLGYQRSLAEAREAWALCRAAGEASLWSLTGEGMNALEAGELDAAATPILEAARRFPDLPAALICLACLDAARGDHARSQAREDACMARFPAYSPAHRALLAALRHDRDAALRLVRHALILRDLGLLPAVIHPAFDWLAADPEWRLLRNRCPIWAQRAQVTT